MLLTGALLTGALLTGALLIGALLTAAGAASAETVGFSQVGAESDWRTAFSTDMKAEAKLRGITLQFDDAHGSVEEQFAAVRRFIAEHVDAIVIAPVVVTGWTPVLTGSASRKYSRIHRRPVS